jgi:4-amino-4-deoxy-L-arabinose transferase-like glycosyltransferase
MRKTLSFIEQTISTNKFLVAILFITFLARVPSLFEPLWVEDEAIYLTIGQKILRGGLLYANIFDHKPPGIYYLVAAAIKLLGPSIWSLRFLLMIWVLATLTAFYFLVKKVFGQREALVATILLSILTSTPLIEGNVANSEILMILPIILGVLVGLNKNFFLSGTFFSLAFLLKFPAVFDFAAFFVFIGLAINKGTVFQTLKNLSGLVSGFLVPVAFVSLYFAARGTFGVYFSSAFLYNVSYVGDNNHFIVENGLLFIKALPLLILLIYLIKRALGNFKSKRKVEASFFQFLVIWLVFSFYGAILAGRPYEHYLIQVAPSFSLIAALTPLKKSFTKIGGLLLVLVVIFTFIFRFQPNLAPSYYLNFFRFVGGKISFDTYADSFEPNTARNYALATFLTGCQKYNSEDVCVKTRTGPGDKLYVFSNAPAIYFLSALDPASRYVNFWHVVDNKEIQGEVAGELLVNPPKYILVEKDYGAKFPELEKIVSSKYNLFAFYEDMGIYQIAKSSSI